MRKISDVEILDDHHLSVTFGTNEFVTEPTTLVVEVTPNGDTCAYTPSYINYLNELISATS